MKKVIVLVGSLLVASSVLAAPGPGPHHRHRDCLGPDNCPYYQQQRPFASAPQGFSEPGVSSVKEIKDSAVDDQYVRVQGSLTSWIGKDKYEFTDLKGDKIVVDLDDDYNWSYIKKDQKIEIVGEVDKNFRRDDVKIDVYSATPLE